VRSHVQVAAVDPELPFAYAGLPPFRIELADIRASGFRRSEMTAQYCARWKVLRK
jgi:hypothetical protein